MSDKIFKFQRFGYHKIDAFIQDLFSGTQIYNTIKHDYSGSEFANLESGLNEEWRTYSATVPVVLMTPDRWAYYRAHNSLIQSDSKRVVRPIMAIKSEGSTTYENHFPTHEDVRIYLSGSDYRIPNKSNWMTNGLIFGADFDDEDLTQITDFSNNNYHLSITGGFNYESRISGSLINFSSSAYANLTTGTFLYPTISCAATIYNSSSYSGNIVKYESGSYSYGVEKDTSSSFKVWYQSGSSLYELSSSISSDTYHILGFYYNANSINLYLDGTILSSSSTSSTVSDTYSSATFQLSNKNNEYKIDDVWVFSRSLSDLEWENIGRLGREEYEKILWYNENVYLDESQVPTNSGTYYYRVKGYKYPYYYPPRIVKNSYSIIAQTNEIAEANQIMEAINAKFYNSNFKSCKWSGAYYHVELTDLSREIPEELADEERFVEVLGSIEVESKLIPRIYIEENTLLLSENYSVGTTITNEYLSGSLGWEKIK